MRGEEIPDALIMEVPGLAEREGLALAQHAQVIAKRIFPKLSGNASSRIFAVAGDGWWGLHWLDEYVWYQEAGIRAFTMRSLEGKTVPMWIDDPTGKERKANPKAKVRVTASGRTQVLIFRRAARKGQRRTVTQVRGGQTRSVQVPASYPGAPGRIALREARQPYTSPGKVGGRIAASNVGVRWRHPGLAARHPLAESIRRAGSYRRVQGPVRAVRMAS